jgi:hypothetical protein
MRGIFRPDESFAATRTDYGSAVYAKRAFNVAFVHGGCNRQIREACAHHHLHMGLNVCMRMMWLHISWQTYFNGLLTAYH